MKATLLISMLISVILIESCGGSKRSGSSSGTVPDNYYSRHLTPVIDGNMNEWGDALLVDKSTKCIYSIANDDSALYIVIKSADRMQQTKIVQGGVEIWVDETAKKKKTMGVKFPVGGGNMQMQGGRNSGARQDPKEMRQQMKIKMLTMELTGFKAGLNGRHDVFSNVQVKPVIEWDDKDHMVYELIIPFAALNETTRANLHTISIGIFIKGLKMEQGAGGGIPGAGRPGGGPPGGGMRAGGGGMPDQSQMENMLKDDSFWTKYTIAKKG